MTTEERQELMQILGSLTGLQEGPHEEFADGKHYEYDPELRTTVEVGPSGERFPVALGRGKIAALATNNGTENRTVRTLSKRTETTTGRDRGPDGRG